MTITAFIPFERKPAKGKASTICKGFGFTERAATSTMWVYGLGRFKVEVMDFRDDMLKSDRAEWVDEVGWQHKWAIAVSIHTQRREEQYIQWHVLTQALAWAYGVKEVWLDGATTIPQEAFNIEEFFEGISKSDDAEDKSPSEDMPDMPELEQELVPARVAPTPDDESYMPVQELPVQEEEVEHEPQQPEPQLVEEISQQDDDDDDGWDDWDDWDDDEDEDDSEAEEEIPQPVEEIPQQQDDENYQFDDDDEDEDDGLVDSITSW